MTETEYKQIQEVFKPVKTLDEIRTINNDIVEINSILSTFPFNMVAARQKKNQSMMSTLTIARSIFY